MGCVCGGRRRRRRRGEYKSKRRLTPTDRSFPTRFCLNGESLSLSCSGQRRPVFCFRPNAPPQIPTSAKRSYPVVFSLYLGGSSGARVEGLLRCQKRKRHLIPKLLFCVRVSGCSLTWAEGIVTTVGLGLYLSGRWSSCTTTPRRPTTTLPVVRCPRNGSRVTDHEPLSVFRRGSKVRSNVGVCRRRTRYEQGWTGTLRPGPATANPFSGHCSN